MSETIENTATAVEIDEEMIQASLDFIKNWNKLVSMTNWEKGKIISLWRESMKVTGAQPQDFSDEAWARMVGNVSGQHVGRLRRVYDRFGEQFEQYDSLFWSHFQAALDWNDAEMWLEGAVQNNWTVMQMRSARWESIGAPPDKKPKDEDIIVSDLDEDVNPADDSDDAGKSVGKIDDIDGEGGSPFDAKSPIDGDLDDLPFDIPGEGDDPLSAMGENFDPVRPFENLPELPEDLEDAFESLKVTILNHKISKWRDVPAADVLASLNALKAMVLAPSE